MPARWLDLVAVSDVWCRLLASQQTVGQLTITTATLKASTMNILAMMIYPGTRWRRGLGSATARGKTAYCLGQEVVTTLPMGQLA